MISTDPLTEADLAIGLSRALIITIPLLVVLAWATVDIWRRPDLRHKLAWTLGCWLLWPVLIAYLAARPRSDGGTRRMVGAGQDPRSQLVQAVLQFDQGKFDAAQFARRAEQLRGD